MKHNKEKYLLDILLSIQEIEKYIINVTSHNQIEENQMLFDALCRRFSIIGEALYQANKIDKNLVISYKEKIMSLRHIIVHDYDMVRSLDLYIIIQKNLNLLKQEVALIIDNSIN
ncbi:MAG: DUF86 domain-containing protein [Chitinophagaceae bacterium]